MDLFSGIWVPLVTPFYNGQIDLVAAQRLTRHVKADWVKGIETTHDPGYFGVSSASH